MSFAKWTQFAKQTVGVAEGTQETPEFTEMIQRMKDSKIELTAIYEAAKKYHAKQSEAADALEKFSGTMAKYSSEDPSARSNLLEAVPMYSKSAAAEQEYLNLFKSNLMDVVHSILEIQVKAAEKALKQLGDDRLEYDAMNSKFKSTVENTKKSTQEDIERAKRKAEDAEAAYEKSKQNCIEACTELQTAKNQFAHNKIATVANDLGHCGAAKCQLATNCLETLAK